VSGARALALLVAVAAMAGCGGREPAAVPQGFTRLDGPTYTFAHPAGWQGLKTETVLGAQGPKGTGGLEPQAGVSSGQAPASLELVMDGFLADQMTRRGNWEVLRDEPIEVEGAEEARITDARYDQVTGDVTTPVRMVDVHAITEDGMLYDFFVRAPVADFDRARLDEVLDTFRLK